MRKRIGCILFAAIINATLFAMNHKCGQDASWSLDKKTRTLHISGKGPMTNYDEHHHIAPWHDIIHINKIVISDGITSIGSYAFTDCVHPNLIVQIPNSVERIEEGAFINSNLGSTFIPSSVIYIGPRAFEGCGMMKSLTISKNVVNIGDKAFSFCINLTSVIIPNSVKSIGDGAFSFCWQLTSIVIPQSVKHIGKEVFKDCKKLTVYSSSLATDAELVNMRPAKFIRVPQEELQYYYPFSTYAREYVENNINRWQKKGEFEKLTDWQKRVNEQTQKQKINDFLGDAQLKYIDFWKQKNQLDVFLSTYDTENEVFLLKDSLFGNMLVAVPISEARDFKRNWSSAKLTPNYFIDNDKLAIASLDIYFPSQNKHYTYSNQASLTYEIAHVDYHFDPFEINAGGSIPKGQQNIQKRDISIGKSSVDLNIPMSSVVNNNVLVLIIANENYQSMPRVPYAVNDGNIFKEYCNKTLGIPQDNITSLSDATLNGIRQKLDLLQKKVQARSNAKKETNIIVYYTGHGVPDGNTRSAYLMPIDGYEENISTGYKLDDLYQQLGKLPAKSITVFLDACFSGVNRNDEALAQHKGARLVAKSGMPTGNMVVFAASQGNQTAFVNDKEQHGLFTYYLLKKLQDSKGDVTLDVLANYLTSEVNLKSLDLHEKEQVPSINASPQVQNQWQNWKLK